MNTAYTCPVCGFPGLGEPARTEGGGGSYEICEACGFEFGFDDDSEGYSYEAWRLRWIARGMPWDSAGIRPAPDGWDPAVSLRGVVGAAPTSTHLSVAVGDQVRLANDWRSWNVAAGTVGTVVGISGDGSIYDIVFEGDSPDEVAHLGPSDIDRIGPAGDG